MRLDKLRKTAEDLAKGVPQSNLTCDFDHRSRQVRFAAFLGNMIVSLPMSVLRQSNPLPPDRIPPALRIYCCAHPFHGMQAAAEKYFEKHLLGKLAAQEESTKGSIPPETLEREPSGWPTDDGWVPSGATSLNGSESLLGQSRPPKTGASHPSLPADEPKAQGGKGAGSGYPGYDAPTQVIVPNKSAFEVGHRPSALTVVAPGPKPQALTSLCKDH